MIECILHSSQTFLLLGCVSLILFGSGVILSRNPIYSLFYLICVFIQISMLLLALGIDFLAFLLLMVYVGAISILFLFVVMMMDINLLTLQQPPLNKKGLLVLFVLLNVALWLSVFWEHFPEETFFPHFFSWSEVEFGKGSLHTVSTHLYSSYAGSFIIAAYVLLVAMVGAISITLKQKPYVKRQDVIFQNHRDFEKTVRRVSTTINRD